MTFQSNSRDGLDGQKINPPPSLSSRKREYEIEEKYRALTRDLKSVLQDGEHCKCLVRLHNCSPYRVTPFWIDFRGLPIKYPTLVKGASIDLDTYISHLWFFRPQVLQNNSSPHNKPSPAKILALPEETLRNLALNISNVDLTFANRGANAQMARNGVQEAILGLNNSLVCSLCRFLLNNHSQVPLSVPCPHFTGEAKFSVSDIQCRSWSSYNSAYIYSCNQCTHRKEHSISRRNIYLVEPFHNLRERCFLALKDRIRHADIVKLNLPTSLQDEYLKFVTSWQKLNEHNKNV